MTKKRFLAPILIAASAFLAACSSDTIIARPIWADEKIVEDVEKDNKLKEIYDAIKKLSDTNPAILNNILSKIAEQQFGSISFGENPAQGKEGLETYKDESSYATDPTAFDKFVADHPVYAAPEKGVKMSDGKAVEVTLTEADKREISRNKIERRYNEVVENIYEKLFNEINGGSYSVKGLYSEKRFINHLRKEMYTAPKPEEVSDLIEDKVIGIRKYKPSIGGSESWEGFVNANGGNGYLHVVDPTTKQYIKVGDVSIYGDYIKRKVIPEIYRNFLTQSYAKEQNYSSMGRTYARKVHMITIHKSDDVHAWELLHNFANDYIVTSTAGEGADANFDIVENAMRGYVEVASAEEKLLDSSSFQPYPLLGTQDAVKWKIDGKTYKVYKGTKLAEVVATYNKIYEFKPSQSGETDGPGANFISVPKKTTEAEDAYKELTNSGAYSVQHGLELKYREINNTTYTKDGWYLKSEGVSDVGDNIKNRLFNIDISDIIDGDKEYHDGDYAKYYNVMVEGTTESQAYLTEATATAGDAASLITIRDGDNCHIIRVEEAISTSKLADVENKGSYAYKKCNSENPQDSTKAMDDIVFEVVKKVASGSEYKTNAEQYYLMVSNIIFYDQDLYDYFKSQYPDIFK